MIYTDPISHAIAALAHAEAHGCQAVTVRIGTLRRLLDAYELWTGAKIPEGEIDYLTMEFMD